MFCSISTGMVMGMNFVPIQAQIDVAPGLPSFDMVGFLGQEIKEAKERVRVALKNVGYELPVSKVTVNLAPGNVQKSGTAYDLAIAVGIICASGYVEAVNTEGILMVGEIGLDGKILPVPGILPIVLQAKAMEYHTFLVPKGNEAEGKSVEGVYTVGVSTLTEAISFLNASPEERKRIWPQSKGRESLSVKDSLKKSDFLEVIGQEEAKQAAMVAAAGFHNILMIGPPGVGKSMIASRIPSILPPLSKEEMIEVSSIYSIAGKLSEEDSLIRERPFVAPHHSLSDQALVGGGRIPKPGAVSLAHQSVLFLDELTEYKRNTLELLRQPMEDRKVTIHRVIGSYTFPAKFMLVAAMNPCPCGYFPNRRKCKCTEPEIRRYLSKISGPILDRIDITAEINSISPEELMHEKEKRMRGMSSEYMKEKVKRAVCIQEERYQNESFKRNAGLPVEGVERYCLLGKEEKAFLKEAFEKMQMSARSYHRLLRVARTIADMEGSERIQIAHLAEAIGYRSANRKYWG